MALAICAPTTNASLLYEEVNRAMRLVSLYPSVGAIPIPNGLWLTNANLDMPLGKPRLDIPLCKPLLDMSCMPLTEPLLDMPLTVIEFNRPGKFSQKLAHSEIRTH